MAAFGAVGRDWLKDSKEWTELISHSSEPSVLHENGEVMPKGLTSELKCRQTDNLNTKDPCLNFNSGAFQGLLFSPGSIIWVAVCN